MKRLTATGPRADPAGRRQPAPPQALVLILVLIVLASAASACSSYRPSPAATQAPEPAEPTKAPAGPTAAPAPAAVTAGSLADAGKAVFASICARCHGANGREELAPPTSGRPISLPNMLPERDSMTR